MNLRKYQIFISSTYIDLIDERKTLEDTILNMGHFPVGMEQFSASDDSQWSVIKQTIDCSDYYLLIISNRYGSLTEEGISYTEKEYNYAQSKGIPVIAFIKDESCIEGKCDNYNKLTAFKEKLISSNRIVEWWKNKDELTVKTINALYKSFKKEDRPGWVRNSVIIKNENLTEGMLIDSTSTYTIMLSGNEIAEGRIEEMEVSINNKANGRFGIQRYSVNSTILFGAFDDKMQNFLDDIEERECINEYDEIEDDVYVQILCIDIDNDGEKEILVCVGQINSMKEILVYRLITEAKQPYELIGRIKWDGICYINPKNNIITFMSGSGHFITEYLCQNKVIWERKIDL